MALPSVVASTRLAPVPVTCRFCRGTRGAIVLDLGEPHAAMQTLDRLRSGGYDTRVLIVSGYQPAWNDLVALSIDRVVVVPLPITRAALLDGIDRLLEVTPFVPRVPPAQVAAAERQRNLCAGRFSTVYQAGSGDAGVGEPVGDVLPAAQRF